ncbi:Predicted metalloprotease, contains C-terminal PDZ domain [Formivibrio citricus]|uniref:Predicted metalloprotease, contains C-terminal PDZ domain n=1 Tax=Formivibrio citricus TaxID=83765 RepID=A0A1I4Y692_9NEIS|nr:PDZ domain-containing protein [Formivibrio citricus]SFN33040.1 Predicted metalloprotease, contains C-terminal PDZ domain [Formivibrio citricus]
MTIHYRIAAHSPQAHLFKVVVSVSQPDPAGQVFWLPSWIPGSYLIREFARHVVSVSAISNGQPVKIEKSGKMHWKVAPTHAPLELTLLVYAYDLSVRGAYLDQSRGFFNGTGVFPAVAGQEYAACELTVERPSGKEFSRWGIATSLPHAETQDGGGWLCLARNYDDLIDHPVEIGCFARVQFRACGVPHEIVISGRHDADLKRLKKDIKAICEAQIRFFGEPAPFERYLFLTLAVREGYGGLEHRASTALICSRNDLPLAHETGTKPGYRQFLGLVSHEYFHAWNVKRIKPAAFAPYVLEQEAHTRLLWAFEGITSYYDDLMLLRAGLISEQEYLDQIAQAMTSVQRTPGRLIQSLEDASLDAWIKHYRPDENSPNSQISYYVKGALAALCLDLTIRRQTAGCKSLDDVMRALWQRFGLNFDEHGKGIDEREWESLAQEVTGLDLSGFFDNALRSTNELPLVELLAQFGIESQLRVASGASDKGGWQDSPAKPSNSLGIRTATDNGLLKLTHVLAGGAAQSAGLSANDFLLAIDGLRVTASNLETLLAGKPAGERRQIVAFRRDELMYFDVHPQVAEADTWGLRIKDGEAACNHVRAAWLSGE